MNNMAKDAKKRTIHAGDDVQVIKDGVMGRVIDILGEDDDAENMELMIYTNTGGTVIERASNVTVTRSGR
jgi:hypothetical protein